MKKVVVVVLALIFSLSVFSGCSKKTPKIGVSLGVGAAERWAAEEKYMIEHAEALGAEIEVRRNISDTPKTQKEDCFELIDSGIDVLILTPRDVDKKDELKEILDYATKKKVRVICYARLIIGLPLDFFIGYDSAQLGQLMATYLTERVRGNYMIVKGPAADSNSVSMTAGVKRAISKYDGADVSDENKITVVSEFDVPSWSPLQAEILFRQEYKRVGKDIKGIITFNDKLAGAVAKVLKEEGIADQDMPLLTGMDAEIDAVRRVANSKQAMTIFLNFKNLAKKAIEIACDYAKGEKVVPNDKVENGSEKVINGFMIVGEIITKDNLSHVLIDSGYYKYNEIFY